MTSVMLGLNQSERNTPVSSRMTKLHRAHSPSMNDQWSGKTLRSCFFASPPRPMRWSSHLAAPAPGGADRVVVSVPVSVLIASSPFPEARSDRLLEAGRRDQVPLVVDHDRQLGERPARRAEDHLAVVGEVERRLVAGAEQLMRLRLPQADRAADVRADLGVAQYPLVSPVL